MERPSKPATTPARRQPHPGADLDDVWMEDFPDDLGCLSLSSDGEESAHNDEMGCMGCDGDRGPAAARDAKNRHREIGI